MSPVRQFVTVLSIVGGSAGVPPACSSLTDDHGVATTAGIHLGFQWLLDPDGDPSTPDAPSVVNNSWTMASPGCNLEFQLDLQNLRAAGILPIFAAGNSGPIAGSSRSPANNPEAFAVGATTNIDVIYSSSSRGPSACGQSVYPELVAPGVSIRTSDLYGFYTRMSGTSLSAPHVAGVLALLLSAFPGLLPDGQEAALEGGAVDLGPRGQTTLTATEGLTRLQLTTGCWGRRPRTSPSQRHRAP